MKTLLELETQCTFSQVFIEITMFSRISTLRIILYNVLRAVSASE